MWLVYFLCVVVIIDALMGRCAGRSIAAEAGVRVDAALSLLRQTVYSEHGWKQPNESQRLNTLFLRSAGDRSRCPVGGSFFLLLFCGKGTALRVDGAKSQKSSRIPPTLGAQHSE